MKTGWKVALRQIVGAAALGLAALGSAGSASAAQHAYMSAATEPWYDFSNVDAMNAAFGSDWDHLGYGDSFNSYALLYIDGGSSTAAEMIGYLNDNRTQLESYVLGGGRLFINAASDEQTTFDLVFGATSTQLIDEQKSFNAQAVDPTLELFNGAGSSWDGFFFGHNDIGLANGAFSSLIFDAGSGATLLAGGVFGEGYAMLGGQTNTVFHQSVDGSDPFQLRVNELKYALNVQPAIQSPVPEPEAYAMAAFGLLMVVWSTRRRRVGSGSGGGNPLFPVA
jgi:hypothetical protein